MADKKRPQTPNRGAADIISQVKRKVRRMQVFGDVAGNLPSQYIDGDALVEWLNDWDARAAKKAGGLGKR